jgi:hypothetical protein
VIARGFRDGDTILGWFDGVLRWARAEYVDGHSDALGWFDRDGRRVRGELGDFAVLT